MRERLRLLHSNYAMFGLRNTLRDALFLLLRTPPADRFDARHGTLTAGRYMALDGRKKGKLHGVQYLPTHEAVMRDILRSVELDHRRFVFLDVGSGMGRALLMASDYPFQAIVGVEISEELCRIARDNVARFRSRAGDTIEVVCSDILDYQLPESSLLLYLYNPFPPPVLVPFLDQVQRFAREHTECEVLMVYSAQALAEPLLQTLPGMQQLSRKEVIRPEYCWSLWRVTG